ncbi:helix-turn-helix domain-containing protein [Streptomyces griseus]|uniref:helix-turn-helix domain-containing protein n=1 Tax=Streptomyces griseus TaxID=1911 RepID=UPI00382F1CC3
MLTGVTAPGPQHSAAALRGLLDLLAQGAAAEEFDRPATAARQAGASAAELAEIAEAAAVVLRIRRTLSQHRVREAQLTALFDTASDLAALRDLDAVLRAIVHRAKLLLGTDVTYLSLNDDTAGDTYMRVTDGSVAKAFQRVRLGMGEGLGGLVAQTARPYATGDYQADTRFHHTTTIDSAVLDEGLRAILGVPLRLGSHIIGVLYAADRAPREFTAGEVALLSSLADHAAIAIDGARLLEETRAALVDLNAASETIRTHSEAMRRAEEAHDQLTDLVLQGAGPELLGSIALTGRAGLADADRLLFERASVVTALLMLLRRSVAETEDRVRGELLGDLLSRTGDPGTLAARARRLGVNLTRRHSVFVAHSEVAPRHRLLAATARSAQARNGLAGLHHDHVVLVAPSEEPGPAAQALAAELGQAVGCPVTVGAAGPATGPADLPHAHNEADRCLSALRALGHTGSGGAVADLGFIGVLLGDQADLGGYVRRTLGPVLDYDSRRGTDLVATLDAYFAEGASLTRTRALLHVHVNTVVQRLERIGRLLGQDWNTPARTLEIQLALRLHQLTQGL